MGAALERILFRVIDTVLKPVSLLSCTVEPLGLPFPVQLERRSLSGCPAQLLPHRGVWCLTESCVHSRLRVMEIIIDLIFLTIHNPSFSRGVAGFRNQCQYSVLSLSDMCHIGRLDG